ncbi:TolC family outer membrane protein [Sphingomonas morindae]|uniref:TolC family outer membrane protein n=1 Tax=Sphingomonas morindae TaxID=1541170 RepID=A0ABY4XDQ6_9SPHN|nr:TolC family outer membrane protein [Sphingomonas morindae]USI75042.1 TolC family outer membrane protein [Sphingomonas morindae]
MIKPALLMLALLAGPAGAETLRDAVLAAYASNPVLGAARARQEARAEATEQARAGGRLTLAADGAGGYDKFGYGKGVGVGASAQLPIWTGGRVSSAVRAASADVAAGAEGVRDTQGALLETVVSAYATLLYDQQAMRIARADIALLDTQVADSHARFTLGNATRTDVARLEAQRASANATLASVETALAADLARYRAVVGHEPDALAPPAIAPAALPPSRDEARRLALLANPLYRQSQAAADADAARIDQARANGAPSLALGGGYARDYDLAGRTGSGFPVIANAGLMLHVPILTGGLVASQVRQARAEHRAALFDMEAAARDAVRSADAAWAALAGARAQAEANRQSVDAAELALKGVRAEYAFGLRSTLDILVADESLRGAQLALASSESAMLVAQAALLHATGRLDADAFP